MHVHEPRYDSQRPNGPAGARRPPANATWPTKVARCHMSCPWGSVPSAAEAHRGEEQHHSLLAAAPHFSIPPGVTYKCFGPWKLPIAHGKLRKFQPEVDMSVVHHMILYGATSNRSYGCGASQILYAWARTGQTAPIGLDFANGAVPGLGFAIGAGLSHVSLQIHYQRTEATTVLHGDRSGVRLTMTTLPPRQPLRVQLQQLVPYIPARTVVDLCARCSVARPGLVFGYRNHAHRLGRHIWSDYFPKGQQRGQPNSLGLIDSQLPQIVRLLDTPRKLETGDVLQLHCVYNGTLRDRPTGFDIDEAKGEMCNQYLFASVGLCVVCSRLPCAPSPESVAINGGS